MTTLLSKLARGWPSSPNVKPSGNIAINGKQVIVAMPFDGEFNDLLDGTRYSQDGTPTGSWIVANGNKAYNFTGSAGNNLTLASKLNDVGTGDVVVSIYFKSNMAYGDTSGTFCDIDGLAGDYLVIKKSAFADSITVSLVQNYTTLSIISDDIGTDGLWHHIVAARINNHLVVYTDGKFVDDTLHSVAAEPLTDKIFIGNTVGVEPLNGDIASLYIAYGAGASRAEVQRLARSPFEWMKPANFSPFMMGVTDGTAVDIPELVVLSDIAATNITGSSVIPRVTITWS